MPTLTHALDPWLEIPPFESHVDNFDAAIEAALEAESWVHQTSDDEESGAACETILMLDEETSTFYLYVDLSPVGMTEGSIQVDTLTYTE